MAFSEAFVRSELGPYETRIREAVDAAWTDYLSIPIRHKFRFTRTRANIVFDLIAGHLFAKFDGDAKVRLFQKDETIKLLIGDSLLVRVKKANGSGLGSNIKTQAVMEFIKQAPDIPGLLPDLFKVEVCYSENAMGAEIDAVSVTARDDDVKLWSYEIDRVSNTIVPMPSREADADIEQPDVLPVAAQIADEE